MQKRLTWYPWVCAAMICGIIVCIALLAGMIFSSGPKAEIPPSGAILVKEAARHASLRRNPL